MNTEKYTLIASAEQVDRRIHEMAREILETYPNQSPLFIALLRGGLPFASKLMATIAAHYPEYHPELDFMTVRTYGEAQDASGAKEPEIINDLVSGEPVSGRDVIMLDDVIDHGYTSEFVKKVLLSRGASTVRLAVLASKNVPSRSSSADYIGFETGDKWLVGMGLDDAAVGAEAYRWLPEIWEINR